MVNLQKQCCFIPKKKIELQLEAVKSDSTASKEGTLKENFLDKAAMNYMFRRDGKPFSKKRLKVHVVGEGIENYIYVEDNCVQCGV